jgi:predicted phosphohydrolase
MKIYGISDLHLSENMGKTMDRFGDEWINHNEKIKNNWQKIVKKDDVVLIAGDISWAINIKTALADLKYIESLNGIKILIRGNHDYWWPTKKKFLDVIEENSLNSIKFISNDFIELDNFLICGTRGWDTLESEFEEEDYKIYLREVNRLENSIKRAREKSKDKHIIVMLHYPPFNLEYNNTKFTEIINKYNIRNVLFGHIHGKNIDDYSKKIKNYKGVNLVSVDYTDFKPILIMEY